MKCSRLHSPACSLSPSGAVITAQPCLGLNWITDEYSDLPCERVSFLIKKGKLLVMLCGFYWDGFIIFSTSVAEANQRPPSVWVLCSLSGCCSYLWNEPKETHLRLSDCAWNCLWDASIFRLIQLLSHSLGMSFPGEWGSSQSYHSVMHIINRRLQSNLIRVNHSGLAIGLKRSSYLQMIQIA